MVLLAGIFALFVVLVGRLRGVLALVGLAVSFAVLSLFILPAILQGSNPLLVAVVGGSAIMLATLYLCHGLSARTSVAVIGTLISLLLIGVLGSLFIDWARLTGNTDDQTGLVHGLFPGIGIQGLLLAGVLIGSLGVLDDVTVTQTSAVWELKEADPGAGWRKLYGAAMRIGRDHIASVVNTLVLAYAGAALPLLLLFSIARSGVTTVATSEVVAEEIVRTLVGSIGLVASVPVTTLLAALVVSSDRRRAAAASAPSAPSAPSPWERRPRTPPRRYARTSPRVRTPRSPLVVAGGGGSGSEVTHEVDEPADERGEDQHLEEQPDDEADDAGDEPAEDDDGYHRDRDPLHPPRHASQDPLGVHVQLLSTGPPAASAGERGRTRHRWTAGSARRRSPPSHLRC